MLTTLEEREMARDVYASVAPLSIGHLLSLFIGKGELMFTNK